MDQVVHTLEEAMTIVEEARDQGKPLSVSSETRLKFIASFLYEK